MIDARQSFQTVFAQEWADLQLIFWEARYKVNEKKRYDRARGYEVCRTSSACWIRRLNGNDYKRGYYGEDSESDS